ncbi:GGDEF domain-containing protein [bacterium]|nr:GGDEF domain-containing protein [bacterium]
MASKKINPDATVPAMSAEHLMQMEKKIASLIVVKGQELGKEYRLNRSLTIIGRDASAHITLTGDPRISRQHASIRAEYNLKKQLTEYILTDMASTNHTYINGEKISDCKISPGDKITFGDTILKFVLQDEIDASYHEEIQRRLNYDQLTGLLTRESYELAFRSEIEKKRLVSLRAAQFMMDIDRFKNVNDTYGHLAGSSVLSKLGDLLRANARDTDLIGRYGGEEFIIFLTAITPDDAIKRAKKIRSIIKNHDFIYKQQTINITLSIGISFYPEHGQTLNELIHAADVALYEAKRAGRDRVAIYKE